MTGETAPAQHDWFKIRLWAVIGPPDSGKSSIIGALASQAGQGRGGAREMLLRGGGWLRVDAFRQSQQEAKRTPVQTADAITRIARTRQARRVVAYHNVLLALRSDSVHGLPTAEAYLNHFIKLGWEIQSLVLLDADEYDIYARYGAPLGFIERTVKDMAFPLRRNWIYGYVRNHFGWA